MLEKYLELQAKRNAQGIPALPLNPEQTKELCVLLKESSDNNELILDLFEQRISPGVDPSAEIKAEFLNEILKGKIVSPLIDKKKAIEILSTMIGGYNVVPLIEALKDETVAKYAVKALSGITLVYDSFETVAELSKTNKYAKEVLISWANAEWFLMKPELSEEIKVKVYKVDGEINTDDFSPAGDAWSRPDIPLHALAMGKTRFPDGIETISKFRSEGFKVAFAGDVVGTGSSRKSAANSVLWHTGEDIPFVPNKRRESVILGGAIAPIFFNTAEDSGALPITVDVSEIKTGDELVVNTKKEEITVNNNKVLKFKLSPNTIKDEYRAGGRIPLIIGRALTNRARKFLGLEQEEIFAKPENPAINPNQAFSLAQKMVGKACGVKGVLPGTACEPIMTTVGSQDTTGPMTADEITELACLKFDAPLFMQSFCHTAAYPKASDVKMHRKLPDFISKRGGLALNQGDGVIHSWLNRMLIPDTVGTGGDSHTRFPLGISFPAGSGLVAFAGALGFMPLDMPESVLVRFKGELKNGITLRDVVNAIPYFAIKQGKLTVPKKNKINVFNGRIIEMEGLKGISVEQAFELTDATAERSAAATCIKLDDDQVIRYTKSNVALLKTLLEKGYNDKKAIENRIKALESWLENPVLLSADKDAQYADIIEIDLSEINEPIVCCPNDPDDVKLLSEIKGVEMDDVFIGSCMTNIGHFRAASKIWEGCRPSNKPRIYVAPPTRMDQAKLKDEGVFSVFSQIGARIETPGCSLCMGNQLRVPDKVNVFSTSTRNFNNRMGDGAQVYLGSAELAAIIALKGVIPSPAEYFEMYNAKISGSEDEIYSYLYFHELTDFDKIYNRRDI